MNYLRCTALTALSLKLALTVQGAGGTNGFWFGGPEIYPIDDSIGLLHAADLNGDGLNDLIVADNELAGLFCSTIKRAKPI